jgi:integrase
VIKPEGPKGPSEPLAATGPSLSASQLFEAYIRAAKLAPETIIRRRVVFTELDAHLAGRAFDALSDKEAQEWITSRVTDKRSALTVQKIYIASLKAIGRWAVRQKDISVSRNPFEGCSIVVPRKARNRETRAFTTDEMHTILSAASAITPRSPTERHFLTETTRRWVPWICAYTGARAGEITQLRGKDVIERDGVRAIRITPEAGTNKTKQARAAPIHEHLIAQGLLDYVKSRGSGPLFYDPEVKPRGPSAAKPAGGRSERRNAGRRLRRAVSTAGLSSVASDITEAEPSLLDPKHSRAVHVRSSLARWIRSIGITDPEVSPTHGWRHTFKQIANRHDISDRESDAITGHAPPTEGRKYGAPTLILVSYKSI